MGHDCFRPAAAIHNWYLRVLDIRPNLTRSRLRLIPTHVELTSRFPHSTRGMLAKIHNFVLENLSVAQLINTLPQRMLTSSGAWPPAKSWGRARPIFGPEHGGGTLLRNVDSHWHYMALYPRRWQQS